MNFMFYRSNLSIDHNITACYINIFTSLFSMSEEVNCFIWASIYLDYIQYLPLFSFGTETILAGNIFLRKYVDSAISVLYLYLPYFYIIIATALADSDWNFCLYRVPPLVPSHTHLYSISKLFADKTNDGMCHV